MTISSESHGYVVHRDTAESEAECMPTTKLADKSGNIIPPSDDEDGAEFEYLTSSTPRKLQCAFVELRDHCKAQEKKLAAEALKHLTKFMAHTYRLNRDTTSKKDFPQPTFAQFIDFTKVCVLPSENVVSSSTSCSFSPVLQRYDSNGNYYPSPVPTTIPETVSQDLELLVTYSSNETVPNGCNKTCTEMEKEKKTSEATIPSLDSDVIVKEETRSSDKENVDSSKICTEIKLEVKSPPAVILPLDSDVIVNECSPNLAICISDEDDTQELINKLMTPGINTIADHNHKLPANLLPQSENTTLSDSDKITDSLKSEPHQTIDTTSSNTSENAQTPNPNHQRSHLNRKLFGDLNTSSAQPTSSSDNFSDESQPIRTPPQPRTNQPSTSEAIKRLHVVQVNPIAADDDDATRIDPQLLNVVSAAQINRTISSCPSLSSSDHRHHHHHPLYLKLARIVAASFSFTSNTDRLQMSVQFAHHSHVDELNEESARRLLQLHGGHQWMAARSLIRHNPSYSYDAFDTSQQLRRSLGERTLNLLFKSRNFVRDGVVVIANEMLGESSRICYYRDVDQHASSDGSGSLDESVCVELRNCLRQRRLSLGLG